MTSSLYDSVTFAPRLPQHWNQLECYDTPDPVAIERRDPTDSRRITMLNNLDTIGPENLIQ